MAGGVARSVQSWSPIAMETAGYADPAADPNFGMGAGNYLLQATQEAAAAPVEQPASTNTPGPEFSPDQLEARAAAALAAMEAQAERQRKAAKNPLNVLGSIVGGVVGLPFAFLENAVGGGQNDLTAPFRPNQTAESRYQAALGGIAAQRIKFGEDIQQIRKSMAERAKQVAGATAEAEQAAFDDAGRVASVLLYVNPSARAQRALPQLQMMAERYPQLKGEIDRLVESGFSDDALAIFGSRTKDEGARARLNEYLYGNKTVALGDGVGVVLPSRPGGTPQVVYRGGNVPPPAPYIGAAPAAPITAAPQTATGPVNITDFVNIPSANPLDPNAGATPNVRRPVAPVSPPPGFVLD